MHSGEVGGADVGTLRGGPGVPGPALTSVPFRHCDVEVVAEGRCLHDAVGDLVVWRGVLIRCLGCEQREYMGMGAGPRSAEGMGGAGWDQGDWKSDGGSCAHQGP